MRPMLAADVLCLGGLDDAMVEATVGELGLGVWLPSRMAPTRMHLLADQQYGLGAECRLEWAAAGHYCSWLVEAGDGLTAALLRGP